MNKINFLIILLFFWFIIVGFSAGFFTVTTFCLTTGLISTVLYHVWSTKKLAADLNESCIGSSGSVERDESPSASTLPLVSLPLPGSGGTNAVTLDYNPAAPVVQNATLDKAQTIIASATETPIWMGTDNSNSSVGIDASTSTAEIFPLDEESKCEIKEQKPTKLLFVDQIPVLQMNNSNTSSNIEASVHVLPPFSSIETDLCDASNGQAYEDMINKSKVRKIADEDMFDAKCDAIKTSIRKTDLILMNKPKISVETNSNRIYEENLEPKRTLKENFDANTQNVSPKVMNSRKKIDTGALEEVTTMMSLDDEIVRGAFADVIVKQHATKTSEKNEGRTRSTLTEGSDLLPPFSSIGTDLCDLSNIKAYEDMINKLKVRKIAAEDMFNAKRNAIKSSIRKTDLILMNKPKISVETNSNRINEENLESKQTLKGNFDDNTQNVSPKVMNSRKKMDTGALEEVTAMMSLHDELGRGAFADVIVKQHANKSEKSVSEEVRIAYNSPSTTSRIFNLDILPLEFIYPCLPNNS